MENGQSGVGGESKSGKFYILRPSLSLIRTVVNSTTKQTSTTIITIIFLLL